MKLSTDQLEQGLFAPNKKNVDQKIVNRYFKDLNKFCLSGGGLHRKATLNGQEFLQLFLPQDVRILCSRPSMMTLDTRAEIAIPSLLISDSFGLGWTHLSNLRLNRASATDAFRGKQISAREQSW